MIDPSEGSGRGAAEAGTDEQVSEDRVVLHQFECEAAEVISGGLRWSGLGGGFRFREGEGLAARARGDGVADVR